MNTTLSHHRRAAELSPAEVRAILAQRLRRCSRIVLAELHRVSVSTIRAIECGRHHRAVFAEVHAMPATKRLRKIAAHDKTTAREARELAATIGTAEPHTQPTAGQTKRTRRRAGRG
jgi:hypothetical protein